ncbi:MAG TPA: hypothetical protein VEG38_04590 [Acidimicrobiia bacterium]|nr:hypothetical protein [Acidimicrobiia bacterium]
MAIDPSIRLARALGAAAILTVGCLTPVMSTPAKAADEGSPLLSETFSGTTVPDAAVVPLGSACLTAAAAAPPADQSKLGPCAKVRQSPPKTTPGFLQLTDASNGQAGAVLYNRALPANGGIQVTFDQYQYGGNGADGVAFFLVDGSANLTATGAAGGALGYAQATSGSTKYPGVAKGYLGVGLDAYGNFLLDQGGQGAGCANPSPRKTRKTDVLGVRGPGDGMVGYCWVGDNIALPGSLRGAASGTDTAPARRTVRVTVTPEAKPTLTVDIDFQNGKGLHNVLTTKLPSALPSTFKFGLAGSTGGLNDVHLIRNTAVTSVVPLPAINLVKQVNQAKPQPPSYTVGDTVPYDLVVTNTTGAELRDVVVTDPQATAVTCPATRLAPAGRAGSTMVCSASHKVTADDVLKTTFTNTAAARATEGAGEAVSATSSVTVPITAKANLSIVKATTKQVVTAVGEPVPYSFTVTNYGNLPLKDITVRDPFVDQVSCPATEVGPGEQIVCTAAHTTTQEDLDSGQVANIAEVTGTDSNGGKVTAHSAAVTVRALFDPAVTIVKSTPATTFSSVGQQIPYTFTVTNVGNVTLDGIVVTDPKVGQVNCPSRRLASTSTRTCTASYTVKQADLDAGEIVNQASVTGLAPGGREISAVSNQHVLSGAPRPELAIVKAGSSPFYDEPDDSIDYSFTVTNTGNQTLNDVAVTDPLLGGTVCSVPSLAPGTDTSCSGTHRITAADLDAGRVVNRAAAVGTSPDGTAVTAVSNEVEVPGVYRPELTMVKSTKTTAFDAAGLEIPFRFAVINTGNVTLDNVAITDAKIADVDCPQTKLALGEQMTCEGVYTVTQSDVDAGRIFNQATIDAEVPRGGPDLPPAPSNEVAITGVQRPAFSMVKSADVAEVTGAGQQVRYSFAITNTGNTTIENIAVSDPKVPAVQCPATVVAPGASLTCTASYTVTEADVQAGRVTNIAGATGNVPGHPPLPQVRSNQVETPVAPAAQPARPAGTSTPVGTVVEGEVVTQPGVLPPAAAPAPEAQLPRTGGAVLRTVLTAFGLAVCGALLRRVRP